MRTSRLPRRALWTGVTGTLLVHAGAITALLLTIRPESRNIQPSYAVQLVAGSPPVRNTRPAPEAAPAPAPAPPPKALPKAAPKPAKPVAKVSAKAPAKAVPQPAGRVTPLPGETPKGGSDIANVQTPGKEFPYPEYLRNLVTQIYRRWNRPAGNSPLEAEVAFVILRDGTVKDIKLLRSSGSYSFNEEAQGAIEAAALAKAFGPLPAGYPADYLPISFSFSPRPNP